MLKIKYYFKIQQIYISIDIYIYIKKIYKSYL